MIAWVSGHILENQNSKIVVKVAQPSTSSQKSPGVGYQLIVPGSSAYQNLIIGDYIEFYVYTHVREDALDLYGFLSVLEKEIFLLLISVNKVGPKMGLNLLSQLNADHIIDALLQSDIEAFAGVSGVGKKTAERLVLELRDQLRKKMDQGLILKSKWNPAQIAVSKNLEGTLSVWTEAKEALMSLGYRELEVTKAIQNLTKAGVSTDTTTQLVRLALKEISKS